MCYHDTKRKAIIHRKSGVNWADGEVSPAQQGSVRRCKHICSPPRLHLRNSFCKTSSLSTLSNPQGWPSTSAKAGKAKPSVNREGQGPHPGLTRNKKHKVRMPVPDLQAPRGAGQEAAGQQEQGPHRHHVRPRQHSKPKRIEESKALWCNECKDPDFTPTPPLYSDKNLAGDIQSDPCTWFWTTICVPQQKQNDHQVSPSSAATANVRTHCTSQGNII